MNDQSTVSTSSLEIPAGYSVEEWQCRIELAACYRLIDHFGWTSLVYNHITARIPGTEEILINPFGQRYDEITASSLIRIDLEGNKLDDSPYPVNKAGYVIHSAVHAARPDIQCALHTHSDNSEALSCIASGFIPMTQTGAMFYERVGYHEYEGIALDEDERARLVSDLGTRNHTLVLKNHGVLVCGHTIPWTFTRFFHFENACRTQLKAMAANDTLNSLSHETLVHTRDQFEKGDARAGAHTDLPEWPAYLRLLDQKDPAWRT